MRCGSRRAVAERRRERENIHPPPNCMSRMGVPAAMGMEPDVCFLAPHRHASGHRLTGQWAIPFITWEKPVAGLAAAKGLEQLQGVGADADGAGFAPLAEEANVAAFIQRFIAEGQGYEEKKVVEAGDAAQQIIDSRRTGGGSMPWMK